jgi:hypothetical protein
MLATLRAYNDILDRVTAEYDAIPAGGTSATGAVKAADVELRYSAAPFHLRLTTGDISGCDCIHPSDQLQAKIADVAWSGLHCSASNPCCGDSGDAVDDAACTTPDETSAYATGFFACSDDAECADGVFCNGADLCSSGVCNGHAGDPCTAGAECHRACDEAGQSCVDDTAGTPCSDDGDLCTGDRCDGAGACAHPVEIDPTCSAPTAPGKASLLVKANPDPAKRALSFSWTKGAATSLGDFGDPTSTTSYALCLYDERAGTGTASLRLEASAPGGGSCAGKACWKSTSTGFAYADKDLSPGGVKTLKLVAGASGRAKVALTGRGALLAPQPPPYSPKLTAQVRGSNGSCFGAVFSQLVKNDGTLVKGKSD